jgi:hypothetical protein
VTDLATKDAPEDALTGTTILDALDDDDLFARWLKRPETWNAWRAFLATLFGLSVTPEQAALVEQCTGRSELPSKPFTEGWLICGRRAGKSFILALVAVFLACFKSYAEYLQPGERATIVVIAADRKQARTIYRYIEGLISGTPLLRPLLDREPRADGLDLSNGVTIEISTASYKTTRGLTLVAALCDEVAFWPTDDSAEPDFAVLDALRPSMATIPNAMLLVASSPYARRGALWTTFKRYYGTNDSEVLVWRAATRTMNKTVPQSVIDRATERDASSAAAEYLAEFRSDLEAFVTLEIVEAAITHGVRERAPITGITYRAFVDPSGGASDSMTMAIAHLEKRDGKRVLVLDVIRERLAPFSPEAVVTEFAETLKRYRVTSIKGDRYGGAWPAEGFKRFGIRYFPAEKPKSDLYRDFLPELNSGSVALLDHKKMVAQLIGLERRTSRGGRDMIDHPPGGKDDIANAIAGCLLATIKPGAVLSGCIVLSSGPRIFPGSDSGSSRVWDRTIRTAGPT